LAIHTRGQLKMRTCTVAYFSKRKGEKLPLIGGETEDLSEMDHGDEQSEPEVSGTDDERKG
jgi:hypothetical protein